MPKASIDKVNFCGKRVLLRVDYNVPLKHGQVANDARITATLPTLQRIISQAPACIIIASHLGRPNGTRIVPELSLRPIAERLSLLLHRTVLFVDDCVGQQVETTCLKAKKGQIMLLENLRFHPEEEATPTECNFEAIAEFRASLSRLAEVAINDAFGTLHRAHSSIVGLSIPVYAGLLVQKELAFFTRIMQPDFKLDLVILGGAKVSDKIALIESLLGKTCKMVIAGGMAFTFLHQLRGIPIGDSLFDERGIHTVNRIVAKANALGVELILPHDFLAADSFTASANVMHVRAEVGDAGIPKGWMGLDCGAESTAQICKAIAESKSVLWNGPVGVFEFPRFATGTKAILDALREATRKGCMTVVGGGDSCAAVAKWNAESELSHVSTGGGASLELLEGHTLPGIEALEDE